MSPRYKNAGTFLLFIGEVLVPKREPSPLIPQRGREHLPRGDNGALGVREFI